MRYLKLIMCMFLLVIFYRDSKEIPFNELEFFSNIILRGNVNKEEKKRILISLTEKINLTDEDLFYFHYIKGYFELNERRYYKAEREFFYAKKYINEISDKKILGKFYSDLSHTAIKKNKELISLDYYNKSKDLLVSCDDCSMLFSEIALNRGIDLLHLSRNQQAINVINDAIYFLENKSVNSPYLWLNLGVAYSNCNQFILGVKYKLKALDSFLKMKKYTDSIKVMIDIAMDYTLLENYEEAINKLNLALDYEREYKLNLNYIDSYYIFANLSSAYARIDNEKKALKFIEKSKGIIINLDESIDKDNIMTYQLIIEAEYLLSMNSNNKAIIKIHEAKKRYEAGLAEQFYHLNILIDILHARAHYQNMDYKKSISLYEGVINSIENLQLPYYKHEAYYNLYNLNKYINNTVEAIFYLNKAYNLKLSNFENNKHEEMQFLTYSFNNKRIKQLFLNSEKQLSIAVYFLCVCFFIFLILLLYLTIYFNKNRKITSLNERLEYLAYNDALTGIANRVSLENRLNVPFLYSRAILMLDIDHFKLYNDNYGHQKGDSILINVAKLLETICGSDAFVARYGGEEFIIIIDDDKCSAEELAKDIKDSIINAGIEHKFSLTSNVITFSIGVAVTERSALIDDLALIRNADMALYDSKSSGRNTITFVN
ncbi:GGDEF domain-containing protein [Aliivibrio sp. S2TY2]|uniref:tetratricopeptide repeat-containing diguanylate cyclase n=1 Tax=unclassified Aliivibrio TaxID=2645654 RepID=UPI002378EFF3|nr:MULTISPECIES: GGDEF domain-containing protein [unclassified Aliivibrio]MDD9173500.1 GGDEF domain-containing protein [Aliivibrio sp. S3TY1]MDD9190576.1 GGDEF domain-containing protein [Aliivibrio sp. S2TY2]